MSVWTAQDIINGALSKIGVRAAGETLSADESNDALKAMNLMLDSWGGRDISARADVQITGSFTANQRQFTIGTSSSPDINTPRPMRIETLNIIYPSNNLELPVTYMDLDQYDSFADRTIITGPPQKFCYDPQMPNGVISLYPIPDITYGFRMRMFVALQEMSLLSTQFTMEPTYFEAIMYNLAVRLAPDYEKTVPPEVLAEAERLFNILLNWAISDTFITPDYPVRPPYTRTIYTIE
jgi:hypothetical protein